MDQSRTQHEKEIGETKACWARKPLLRESYRNFHLEIKKRLCSQRGQVSELGSGIGAIKETLPECITTDIFPNSMVDRVEDAYALSFGNDTLSNLILFDVWHHLEYPGSALEEFSRVLVPQGRVILFEPAALSALGQFVFGCFHHEPIHSATELCWRMPEEHDRENLPYYAAQGNAWKMFRNNFLPEAFDADWKILEVTYYPAFDWLAAGGFRRHQLCPSCLGGLLRKISAIGSYFPALFATRMLVVLEKK